MPKYDIDSDDPLEMVWAIREQISEDTKDMTLAQYNAYIQKGCASGNRKLDKIRKQAAVDRAAGVPYKFPWE